jgi:multiple sugar transport system permease protein
MTTANTTIEAKAPALVAAAAAATVRAAPPIQRPGSRRPKRDTRDALIFLSPWIIGFVLFTAGPIVASLVLSFCRWDVISPARFIGLANYRQMFHDRLLAVSLVNTLVYAAMFIPASIVVSLALAMLLNQRLPGMRLFRTIFYLPTLTQGVATFAVWSVVFEQQNGLINRALGTVMRDPPGWLVDPAWAKPALVIMALWSVGGMMLIFLAGLQNVPRQLYESAAIDGAGPLRQFASVTLPMLSPVIFFNLIMATIGSLQVFSAAFILTGGGPSNSTLFYVYYLFNRAFVYFNMGYASAMAWGLFLIALGLTLAQMWAGRKWVHYG